MRAQQDGGVGHGARHGSGGVLAVRDGDDAGAADEAHGRLDADDAVRSTTGRRWSRRSRCRRRRRKDWRPRPRPIRNSSRRDCGRARRDCASGRRGRSSRWWNGSSGSWPTRSGWFCPGSRRPPRAAAAPRRRPRGAIEPSSASEPAVVIMRSAVSMLSLIRTGMPCSGPRGPFSRRSGRAPRRWRGRRD